MVFVLLLTPPGHKLWFGYTPDLGCGCTETEDCSKVTEIEQFWLTKRRVKVVYTALCGFRVAVERGLFANLKRMGTVPWMSREPLSSLPLLNPGYPFTPARVIWSTGINGNYLLRQ